MQRSLWARQGARACVAPDPSPVTGQAPTATRRASSLHSLKAPVSPKGPGSVQMVSIPLPPEAQEASRSSVSPKGPGSIQTQGDYGPMMSEWTARTWTCPTSRQKSRQGRCLAKWQPRLGHLECVLPTDAHWCSQGWRSEQSGGLCVGHACPSGRTLAISDLGEDRRFREFLCRISQLLALSSE